MATVVSFSRLLPKPHPPLSRSAHRPLRIPSPPLSLSLSLTRRRLPRRLISSSAIQENGGGASETTAEEEKAEGNIEEEAKDEKASSSTKVAEELKAMMAARKEKEKGASSADLLIGGVAEEIREIEWPAFGKVVGTTGVVLAVIAGSSVVLLTVNAILAELSDRVFAGRGLQDFF